MPNKTSASPETVWIVCHEESALGNVIGVFGNETEAAAFADEVSGRFAGGVVYTHFDLGYRYDRGSGYVSYEPAD